MEYQSEFYGIGGIVARVVAYSESVYTGERIITYELTYPRIIHGELMTHRLFSRNAASSRAIPVALMNAEIWANPAMPVRFGSNKAGMQDGGVHDGKITLNTEPGCFYDATPQQAWKEAAQWAVYFSNQFTQAGYHKQVCNRLTEPFQFMRTVVTFTGSGANFFGLRYHLEADPTLGEVARCMYHAAEKATPVVLGDGDWHLPYYKDGSFIKASDHGLDKARRVSASCCAQASFRKLDDSQEKADKVFGRLIDSKPVHASPVEHQATPLKKNAGFRSKFVTAVDRDGNAWSGNFRNWGQWRQIIPNQLITHFEVKE